MMSHSKQRKIAIMGYRSVGKSSLTIQFVEGQFVDAYNPTIEYTFTKRVRAGGEDFDMTLVDTAGQDCYSLFPAQYLLDVHGYVLVYSVTSAVSFEAVQVIREKLLDATGRCGVPVVLVGNKTDLYMERVVSAEAGRALAAKWNVPFLEVSAKQRAAVDDVFCAILVETEKMHGNLSQKGCLIS